MRKIHLVLRLFFQAQLSIRAIARSIQASPATVGGYIRRAKAAGLTWPLPDELDERTLEARLFPASTARQSTVPLPDWSHVHAELRRKGVTLLLLWEEYKAEHTDGLQYSWFCEQYRAWSGRLDLVMRQTHRAGERLFVDYAGHTVPVVDRLTGELREAQIFVAVLGASNYTFAEATWTQSLIDWCGSHVRALRFLGGVPELIVPDYVPGNIIGLMWPARLCGGIGDTAEFPGGERARGNITVTGTEAIRARIRRHAMRAFGGIPPKHPAPEVHMPRAPVLSSVP